MAKTRFVFVKGKTKWFRSHLPDPWNKYKHVLYPDQESLELLRDLQAQGMKNPIKKDEDGWYVTLSRPASKEIRGKVVGFTPPEVLMADGVTPLRDTMVGNGSDVTTKLEVYKHKTPGGGEAVAARWLSSRIDNLIPFDGKKDFDEGEQRAVKGLDTEPAPLF